MKKRLFIVGTCLAMALSQAHASTSPFIETDALSEVDNLQLSHECVKEENLEALWATGGKNMRAPRICITDLCAKPYSEEDFGRELVGEAITGTEYWQYARLANSVCGFDLPVPTDAELMKFIFDGSSIPPGHDIPDTYIPAAVPVPAGFGLLLTALLALVAIKQRKLSHGHVYQNRKV